MSVFGLALPSIAENSNATIVNIIPALVSRGTGYLLGSATGGLLEG